MPEAPNDSPGPTQLERYAADLREVLTQERRVSKELGRALSQLEVYAKDLHKAVSQERQRANELEAAYEDTLMRLLRASSFRDDETGEHCKRLSAYVEIVAHHLGLPAEHSRLLQRAAPLHDIGKIGIRDAILLKPGALSAAEMREMQRHPAIGASMLGGSPSPMLETARLIALTHHERWDGLGYPQKLMGSDIPMAGRIVKLVDVYDALRSRRPYKDSQSHEDAVGQLLEGGERVRPEEFDPALLEAMPELAPRFAEVFDRLGDTVG